MPYLQTVTQHTEENDRDEKTTEKKPDTQSKSNASATAKNNPMDFYITHAFGYNT